LVAISVIILIWKEIQDSLHSWGMLKKDKEVDDMRDYCESP